MASVLTSGTFRQGIDTTTTEIQCMSACEGSVCLRVEDNKHSDFWMEFNLDIATLERLLARAKSTEG